MGQKAILSLLGLDRDGRAVIIRETTVRVEIGQAKFSI
jgi:hypothetical protein